MHFPHLRFELDSEPDAGSKTLTTTGEGVCVPCE